MKEVIVMVGFIFLMGGRAYGEQAAFRVKNDIQPQRIVGNDMVKQGGSGFGPPHEAYTACEGKTEGNAAQFTDPQGEKVTGLCRIADGRLVLRPDHPKGKARDERRGPPPEAYRACEGKSAGTSSSFVNPRGETVKGTCEEEDGKMVLKPEKRMGSMGVNAH